MSKSKLSSKAKKIAAWNKRLGKLLDDDYGFGVRPAKEHSKSTEPEKKLVSKDEILINLTASDPCWQKNQVLWSHTEGSFVPCLRLDQTVILFHLQSELVDDVDDADESEIKSDEEKGTEVEKVEVKAPPSLKKSFKNTVEKAVIGKQDSSEEEKPVVEQEEPDDGDGDKPKRLLNQFNFYERSTQSYSNHMRDHTCQTKPTAGVNYRDICNQWIISDAYEKNRARRAQEELSNESKGPGDMLEKPDGEVEGENEEKQSSSGENKLKQLSMDKEMMTKKKERREKEPPILDLETLMEIASLNSISGLMMSEKIIVQNMADEFRESGEGTLLPLWKFTYEKAKRLQVTGISWSQSQPDMFVCSFASCNLTISDRNADMIEYLLYTFLVSFGNQYSDGMVVVFSIRNTAYPEQVWSSDNKGPMSVDIHPSENCLIAIGLSDGNVMLLNLKRDESNEPRTDILMNIPTELKHGGAVWHIQWENNVDKTPSFYSTSLDGKIISWTIGIQDIKGYGGLDGVEVANLCSNTNPTIEGPDGQTYKLHGCARCLAFHPKEKTVYLIGSVEGNIYLCSSLYSSKFIQIYHGHFLPVAALQWNYYHSNIFISCSEDWTIKIWDRCYKNPLYVFEIGVPIFDVCWAQYSSTVFAAISEDGKVIVYDLNVNKEKPICEQQIVTRKKVSPMRIQINPYHPILIVGDDKGQLNVLKMSPNLRILPKDPRGNLIEGNLRINYELNKMGKLLSFVHDPNAIKEEKPKLNSE